MIDTAFFTALITGAIGTVLVFTAMIGLLAGQFCGWLGCDGAFEEVLEFVAVGLACWVFCGIIVLGLWVSMKWEEWRARNKGAARSS